MTTARTDSVADVSEDDVEAHGYAWYDPDAAAFELSDPDGDLDVLSDEDAVTVSDWG